MEDLLAGVVLIFDCGGREFNVASLNFSENSDQHIFFEMPPFLQKQTQFSHDETIHCFIQQHFHSVVEQIQWSVAEQLGKKGGWNYDDICHGEIYLDIAFANANHLHFFSSAPPPLNHDQKCVNIKHVTTTVVPSYIHHNTTLLPW